MQLSGVEWVRCMQRENFSDSHLVQGRRSVPGLSVSSFAEMHYQRPALGIRRQTPAFLHSMAKRMVSSPRTFFRAEGKKIR